MRVLIYEPQYVGHNLTYVNYLASRLIEMDCETHLVTSPETLASEEFENHLGHLRSHLRCLSVDGFVRRSTGTGITVNGLVGTRSMMRGLSKGLAIIRPEHLYIPCGNPIAHSMGLPNSISKFLKSNKIESEIVLLFGKYAYPHRGIRSYVKEKLALAALARGPWSRLHHIVPRAVEVMSTFSSQLAERTCLLPDPIDPPIAMTRSEARSFLNLPNKGRYICLVGLIEKRKGVFELLEAFERAIVHLRDDDRILLAGKATDEVRSNIATRYRGLVESDRLISIDRHLTRQELWAACNSADVVTTPYPDHLYSASIVIRAAAVNRLVLANAIGWMGETTERFSLGTTCDTNRLPVFAAKIVETLDTAERFVVGEKGKQFVQFHSQANFADCLTERLRQRLNPTAKKNESRGDAGTKHFCGQEFQLHG